MAIPRRPSTAKLSDKPCPDCRREQLTDGIQTWCVHGGHRLERELGLRRDPPKGEPDAVS